VYRAAPGRSGVPRFWQSVGNGRGRRKTGGDSHRGTVKEDTMSRFRLTRSPRLRPELPPADDPDLPAPSARTPSPTAYDLRSEVRFTLMMRFTSMMRFKSMMCIE
jgi:hypothetical protein